MAVKNLFSLSGVFFGVIALMMGVIHYSVGPLSSPEPTIEHRIQNKISAVRQGIIAGLKGEKSEANSEIKRSVDVDRVLDNIGRTLAIAALLCAFIGGMRKENRWGIMGALFFGGATLTYHVALFSLSLIPGIILILIIFFILSHFLC